MGHRRLPEDAPPPLEPGFPECWRQIFGPADPALAGVEETEIPAIDVYDAPGEVVVEAELPGVDPAGLGVAAGEGLVIIEGTKEDQPVPGRVNYLCMERSFGAFRRVVLIGTAVDITRATASYRDGVLRVRVPKVEEKRGRLRVIPVLAAQTGGGSEP